MQRSNRLAILLSILVQLFGLSESAIREVLGQACKDMTAFRSYTERNSSVLTIDQLVGDSSSLEIGSCDIDSRVGTICDLCSQLYISQRSDQYYFAFTDLCGPESHRQSR